MSKRKYIGSLAAKATAHKCVVEAIQFALNTGIIFQYPTCHQKPIHDQLTIILNRHKRQSGA